RTASLSDSVAGRIEIVIFIFKWGNTDLARRWHFGRVRVVGNAGPTTEVEAQRCNGEDDQRNGNGNGTGDEWRAGKIVPGGGGRGVVGEDLRGGERPNDCGKRAGRVHSPLQFALAVVRHLTRQHAIDGRWREAADAADGDEEIELIDIGREGDADKGDGGGGKADHANGRLAHSLRQRPRNEGLADGKTD